MTFTCIDEAKKIIVWDLRIQAKLGECTSHQGEICALTFCGDFPLFACSDSASCIYIWTVRPYLYPLHLVAQWTNIKPPKTDELDDETGLNDLPIAMPAITALAFDCENLVLYSGDEFGYITGWDVSKLIEEGNVKRKGNATLSEFQSHKFNAPSLLTSHITQKYRWKAHTDGIRVLQVIEKPACILSASYDCNVILWNMNGEQLDKLRQDKKEYMQHPYLPVKHSRANDNEKPFNFPLEESSENETLKPIAMAQKLKKTVKLLSAFTTKSNNADGTFITENEETV